MLWCYVDGKPIVDRAARAIPSQKTARSTSCRLCREDRFGHQLFWAWGIMADRLHISTRKGLFTVERHAAGWGVSGADFLGDTTNMLLRDARDDTLYVAMALGHFGVKLHRSSDQGQTWNECSVPVYPEGSEIGRHPFAEALTTHRISQSRRALAKSGRSKPAEQISQDYYGLGQSPVASSDQTTKAKTGNWFNRCGIARNDPIGLGAVRTTPASIRFVSTLATAAT